METRRATIFAIGGGEIYVPCRPPETLVIDEEIVQAGRVISRGRRNSETPHILFIPTASRSNLDYCNTVMRVYEKLGCEFDLLLTEYPSIVRHYHQHGERRPDHKQQVDWADIIYVGGGDTAHMMRTWRRCGLDRLLIEAASEHKVFCGLSAGMICWFRAGLSDSRRYSHPENWKPIGVKGLGIISAPVCPHFQSSRPNPHERWRTGPAFHRVFGSRTGIGVEDRVALRIDPDGLCSAVDAREEHRQRFSGVSVIRKGKIVRLPKGFAYTLNELLRFQP